MSEYREKRTVVEGVPGGSRPVVETSKLAGLLLEAKGVRYMQQCRCTTTQHDNHPGNTCDKPAITDDVYCTDCRDKAAREHADTKPDMLSYQSRIALYSDQQSGLVQVT
jgi:hypothetical protein